MPDEPTPQEPEEAPPTWAEYPRPADPGEIPDWSVRRNPVGWIASAVMVFMLTVAAIAGYVGQPSGEASTTGLQEALKYSVSIDPSMLPTAQKTLEDTKRKGLEGVLEDATKSAAESDEAARVAVVTAHELDRDPPEEAMERLAKSESKTSRLMARIYDGEASDEETEEFLAVESDEFAVQLGQVHAQEMTGRDSERSRIVDTGHFFKMFAVAAGGVGLLLLGAVSLVVFFVMRSSGRLKAIGFPGFAKADGDRYMIRFALYLVLFLGGGFLVSYGLEGVQGLSDIWIAAATLFAVLVAVALMFRLPVLNSSDSTSSVVGEKQPFWKLVGAGVFGYLCTVPLLALALALIAVMIQVLPEPTHPISEDLASAAGLDWLAIVLTAAVLAPIVEELAFRGLLLPALATQIKRPLAAILVCGLVFAMIHPQGPLAWPALATTGAAAAALRYYTGSLVPSITLHMVHNGLIVVVGSVVG